MTEQVHRLYCPKCDEMVAIPYKTEVSERSCPNAIKCGTGAHDMWPSKSMYERDKPKPVGIKAKEPVAEIVAEEPVVVSKKKGLARAIDVLGEGER